MEIRIDGEFERLIRPLSDEEKRGLRQKLDEEGCWQPFAVWTPADGDGVPILLDGHNRYAWCLEQHATFTLREIPNIQDRQYAKRWIIRNQLSRRNVTQYEAIALARVDEEILKNQAQERMRSGQSDPPLNLTEGQNIGEVNEVLAKKAGTSTSQVRKQKFIDRWGTDEEREACLRGERSIHQVYQEVEARLLQEMWERTQAGESQRQIADSLEMAQSNLNKWLKKARERFASSQVSPDVQEEMEDQEKVPPSPNAPDQTEEKEDTTPDPPSLHLPFNEMEPTEDHDPYSLEPDEPEEGSEWTNMLDTIEDLIGDWGTILNGIRERGGIGAFIRQWPYAYQVKFAEEGESFCQQLSQFFIKVREEIETITILEG